MTRVEHIGQDWIAHNGGDCPINRDTQVRFKFASGKESEREYRAGNFNWRKRGSPFDIAAYQIVCEVRETETAWAPVSGGY